MGVRGGGERSGHPQLFRLIIGSPVVVELHAHREMEGDGGRWRETEARLIIGPPVVEELRDQVVERVAEQGRAGDDAAARLGKGEGEGEGSGCGGGWPRSLAAPSSYDAAARLGDRSHLAHALDKLGEPRRANLDVPG